MMLLACVLPWRDVRVLTYGDLLVVCTVLGRISRLRPSSVGPVVVGELKWIPTRDSNWLR